MEKPISKLLLGGLVLVLLVLYMVLPLSIDPYNDFSVVYFTNNAYLHGIPIYSYAEQLEYISGLTPSGFEFHPFPYPPWFSLSTLLLGMLDIFAAFKLWSFLSMAMILTSVWLLTVGWGKIQRLSAMVLSAFFLPSIGLVLIGQFSGPILFGASLLVFTQKKQSLPLRLLGMFLLTFKPHLGSPILLGWLIWVFLHKDQFGWRSLSWFIGLMTATVGISFLIDKYWFTSYLQSLAQFSALPGVLDCHQCSSLYARIIQLPGVQIPKDINIVLSAVLLAGTVFSMARRNPRVIESMDGVVSSSILLSLLFLPYLLQYDYILLLVPWVMVFRNHSKVGFMPPLSFLALLPGGNGAFVLPVLCLLVFGLYLLDYNPRSTNAV